MEGVSHFGPLQSAQAALRSVALTTTAHTFEVEKKETLTAWPANSVQLEITLELCVELVLTRALLHELFAYPSPTLATLKYGWYVCLQPG